MDIKLDFDPDVIAKKMSEAIVSGSFKSMFEKAVEDEIKRLNSGSSWNAANIINSVVQDYMRQKMREILDKEYKDQITSVLKARITTEKLNEWCDELIQKINIRY